MSVDPLDAVGQGHAWYGYNLVNREPRLDGNGRRAPSDSGATPLEILRRSGGLMADQLFGGFGNPQQTTAAKVKQEVESSNAQMKTQRQDDHFRQMNCPMESTAGPQSQPVANTNSVSCPSALAQASLQPPSQATLMPASPYSLMDIHTQTLLAQPDYQNHVAGQIHNAGHTAAAAAAAAAAGHYSTLDLSLPFPVPGLAEAGPGAGVFSSVPPFSPLQPTMMTAGMAGDGHKAMGPVSGLGLWGWCFPPAIPGTNPSSGLETKVAGGPIDVGRRGSTDGDVRSHSETRVSALFGQQQNPEMVTSGPNPDLSPPAGMWDSSTVGGSGRGVDMDGSVGGGELGAKGVEGKGIEKVELKEGLRASGVSGETMGLAGPRARATKEMGGKKGERSLAALDPSELKRQERNAREQRRSLMTSQQIDKLRALLMDSGVHTKANKCSVLSEVVNYVTKLEKGLRNLEAEREAWLQETADIPEVARRDPNGGAIDCKEVLSDASVALAMATVEGRLMESNSRFKSLSGYGDEELKQLTLLKLTAPPDLEKAFEGLSAMLTGGTGKGPEKVTAKAVLKKNDVERQLHTHTGKRQARLSVSLVRDALGRPKFFLCSLLPYAVKATSLPTSSSSLGESSVAAGASRESSGRTGARSSVPCKRASSAVKVAVKFEGAPIEESQRGVRNCSRKLNAKPTGKGKTSVCQEDVDMACFSRDL